MNHQLPNNITTDMVLQLPGDLKDRRTPLGDLNCIFTAILIPLRGLHFLVISSPNFIAATY
jgi:hypothetical protein